LIWCLCESTHSNKVITENNKCVSKYIGSGETASLIALYKNISRMEKQDERTINKQKREVEIEIDDSINEFSELSKSLVDALFLVNGYHQHKREWRKKR
jgi:hypothetical protein